ncbi:MAG TPA: hypothetical protein VGL75_02910 [Acidothermaceae bacterium]|jgi:tetratricopeptide (TPR) repeat protein
MDSLSADELVQAAEASQAASRRQEPDAERPVDERYPLMVEALGWYLHRGDLDDAFRLASALVSFWMATNRLEHGDEWYARLLAVPRIPDETTARALYAHGYLVFWAGNYDLAAARFTESRNVAIGLGDASLQALALAGLARVALTTDVDEAVRLLREALEVTAGLSDDDRGRSNALHVLGPALQMSGDLLGARDVVEHQLAAAYAAEDAQQVCVESSNLSMIERQLGNLNRAEELSRQAVGSEFARSRELYLAWSLNGLAAVAAAKHELVRAATIIGIASSTMERAGGEWPPDEREQYDETAAIAEKGLTTEQFNLARDVGASMSIDEALSFALTRNSPG